MLPNQDSPHANSQDVCTAIGIHLDTTPGMSMFSTCSLGTSTAQSRLMDPLLGLTCAMPAILTFWY